MSESGFGLVTSTRHATELLAPSSAFFLRSSADFARSKEPVSLSPEPPDGFLPKQNQQLKTTLNINFFQMFWNFENLTKRHLDTQIQVKQVAAL